MLGFVIGLFSGAFIGVFIMCLCNAASNADREMKNTKKTDDQKQK